MISRRQFSLRTLCVIVAGVCVLSGLVYYVRIAATNVIRYSRFESAEGDLEWEFQVFYLHEVGKDAKRKEELLENVHSFEYKLQNGTENEREDAALILGHLVKPGSTAEDRLIESLDAASPRVKRAAIYALGTIGSLKSEPMLLVLLKSTDKRIANEAQSALEKIKKLVIRVPEDEGQFEDSSVRKCQ